MVEKGLLTYKSSAAKMFCEMLRFLVRALVWLLAVTALQPFALAEDTWSELRSPHFRVVTNGSPADARKVALELEQMRFILRWRFPGYRIDFDAPYTVYAVRDYGTALRLAPFWKPRDHPYSIDSDGDFVDMTRMSFFGNWERNVALVQLDTWDKSSRDRLYAAYVHEILIQNVPSMPPWLDHGISEFIATTRFSSKDILLGSPNAGWLDLKSQRLLPIKDLVGARPAAGWSNSDFLAWQLWTEESWALVHFLTFSPGMESGAKLLTLLHTLQSGQSFDASFQAIFGDPAKLDAPFAAYLHNKGLPAVVAPEFLAPDSAAVTEKPLSRAQGLTEEAIFHLETHDLEHGRVALLQALQLDPSLATAHEELGFLDFGSGDLAEARAQWHTAVTLDPARYAAAFATVMTGTPYHEQSPEQLQTTLTELRRIAHLNPLFAPAYTQVAIVLWWQGKADTALHAAMEAQRLAPNRPGYQLLVARLLLANNQPAKAAEMALRIAQRLGNIDGDTAAAFWRSIPTADRDPKAILESKLPPGLVSATGTLSKVSCGDYGSHTPLHLALQVNDPQPAHVVDLTANSRADLGLDDTAWIGGGHSFVCHAATARPAHVLYKPSAKGYGELFALNITDDLPSEIKANPPSSNATALSHP